MSKLKLKGVLQTNVDVLKTNSKFTNIRLVKTEFWYSHCKNSTIILLLLYFDLNNKNILSLFPKFAFSEQFVSF